MTEAALVLPLVLLVIFGCLELGRAVNVMQTLDDAARDAARLAAVPSPGSSGTLPGSDAVVADAHAVTESAGLSDGDVTVTPTSVTKMYGGLNVLYSQVDVTYTYTVSTPMLSALVPSITLHGHALMRDETN